MKKTWEEFENWLSINWPEGLLDLNPPATDNEINELEILLDAKLPIDFIEFLKIHNGQGNMAGGLFDNSEFLSTKEIYNQWKVWKDLLDSGDFDGIYSEPEKGIKNDWWNPKWIPFNHNGGGDHYCIDLDPSSDGKQGQIITMWHDSAEREIQAVSLKAWFESYVHNVCAGKYKYSEDFGGLTHIDYA